MKNPEDQFDDYFKWKDSMTRRMNSKKHRLRPDRMPKHPTFNEVDPNPDRLLHQHQHEEQERLKRDSHSN